MKNLNNPKRILIALAFFAISIGLWGNFRQLWLSDNLLSASEIAKTMSYASLLAALYLIYYTNVVSIQKIKLGVMITMFLKIGMMFCLSFANGSGNIHLIKFLFFVDFACESMILSSIYPFIISYQKSEELYGKKTVIEYAFKTVGILLASLLFGRVIFSKIIGYNSCLIISILFSIISLFTVFQINEQGKSIGSDSYSNKGLFSYIKKIRPLPIFFAHTFLAQISYFIVYGLNMLIFVDYMGFSVENATNYILLFSILASIFGHLALSKFRFKNDYINYFVKFLGRFILYTLIFITNNKIVLLIGVSYFLLTNVAYDYVINGFVFELLEEKFMMSITVLQYIINLIGQAIGVFLAGVMYNYGFRYIYLLAAIVMIVQIAIGCSIISMKRGKTTN